MDVDTWHMYATGSQAHPGSFFLYRCWKHGQCGGATSAPVVASAFHPSLATVGVLLAVLGYALGTYGAYLSALVMQVVAP
jgi:hypothetical protein